MRLPWQESETIKLPLVKYEPDLADMSYTFGRMYLDQLFPRNALAMFQSTLILNPDYSLAHKGIGDSYLSIFLYESNSPVDGESPFNFIERGFLEYETYMTKNGLTKDEDLEEWREKIKRAQDWRIRDAKEQSDS
jgi:hypothetical protein